MRPDVVAVKLVEGAASVASGLVEADSLEVPIAPRIAVIAARNVGLRLKPEREVGYCVICGRGPFRKRGYYLHLVRVHGPLIRQMIEDETRRLEEHYLGQTG